MLLVDSKNKVRLFCVLFTLFFLFSLLLFQYYRIQIIQGERWNKIGENQHFFEVTEPFLRGTFYSSATTRKTHFDQPQKLVIDRLYFHLYVDPVAIETPYKAELADHLSQFLNEPKEQFYKELTRRSRSRRIGLWLDQEMRDAIQFWWNSWSKSRKIAKNALFFAADYKRSYPFGKMLGQVLHTIQHQKDEVTKQGHPTGGLELYFDSYLKGHLGKRKWMRSPINAYEMGQLSILPQNGADIYLTVDQTLQSICEEEIALAVKKYRAKSGFASMMDPFTGRVLAIAQYPFFSPQDYNVVLKDPEKSLETRVKAIQDAQEPGSNMKPITLTIALMANQELEAQGKKPLFDPEEKLSCADGKFPGRTKLVTDTHFHKFLNMEMALQKSSNIYMSHLMQRIVERMGEEWYRDKLIKTFGFGTKTGIELPSESSGVVPRLGKKHPNGTLEWSKSTPYSLAMGHNILTTNLQILRAYAVFANGGYLVTPTLVEKISREMGGKEEILVDYRTRNVEQFPKVLNSDLVNKMIYTMKFTTKMGGTARRADVPGYTEAGKTSTPKKVINGVYSESAYCPVFVGFTPLKKPAFVLIVTLDEPKFGTLEDRGRNHHGGSCSAPTFRQIAIRSLEYLGIAPDDPFGYPYGDPRRDATKADFSKEVEALREKYEKWNNG